MSLGDLSGSSAGLIFFLAVLVIFVVLVRQGARSADSVRVFFDGMALVIVAGYTTLTYQQWQTLIREVRDLEAGQAASITVEDLSVQDFPRNPRVLFRLKNSGPTAASAIQVSFGYDMGAPGLIPGSRPGPPSPSTIGETLGSQQEKPYQYPLEIEPSPFADGPSIEKVLKCQSGLRVELRVDYLDAFGHSHQTAECIGFDCQSREFIPCWGNHIED